MDERTRRATQGFASRSVLLALWLAATAALPPAQTPGAAPALVGTRVGQVFPDVYLPSLEDGKMTRLASLCRGRKVLLIEFASW